MIVSVVFSTYFSEGPEGGLSPPPRVAGLSVLCCRGAGLPGAARLPGVAGSLPGRCRVVAGLGCRVAGARAQV